MLVAAVILLDTSFYAAITPLLPGYAGPNRMAKKTQTVGKPPKPYPGSWNAFCAIWT